MEWQKMALIILFSSIFLFFFGIALIFFRMKPFFFPGIAGTDIFHLADEKSRSIDSGR